FADHPPPSGERSARLTRSVESRLIHRLTIRWRETLFHTIELQHPFFEGTAAVTGKTDRAPRRTGTERHRRRTGCVRRAGWRRADEKARRRRGRLRARRAA